MQHHKPELFATYVTTIWERIGNKPCSAGATAGLLVAYIACCMFGFVSTLVFSFAVHASTGR